MRWIFIILVLCLISGSAKSDEIDTLTCVKCKKFVGVVTSKVITQQDDKQWVFVYTPNGFETMFINELEAIACQKILDQFSKAQKKLLSDWLDGGKNPMMIIEIDDNQELDKDS